MSSISLFSKAQLTVAFCKVPFHRLWFCALRHGDFEERPRIGVHFSLPLGGLVLTPISDNLACQTFLGVALAVVFLHGSQFALLNKEITTQLKPLKPLTWTLANQEEDKSAVNSFRFPAKKIPQLDWNAFRVILLNQMQRDSCSFETISLEINEKCWALLPSPSFPVTTAIQIFRANDTSSTTTLGETSKKHPRFEEFELPFGNLSMFKNFTLVTEISNKIPWILGCLKLLVDLVLMLFDWSYIIRQMAMFADYPLGSRLVSWQVELPTPERLGGWQHTVEASKKDWDRLQKICPDVRMSFHGSNYCTRKDSRWYFVFNHCLKSMCRLRIQAEVRAPKFRVCCDYPQVRVGSWNQCVGGVGQVSGICHKHTDDFVSSNPWKPFKHIEK